MRPVHSWLVWVLTAGLVFGVSGLGAGTSGPRIQSELRVQVQAGESLMKGTEVRVSILNHGMGMGQSAEVVQGPKKVKPGETVKLGRVGLGAGQTLDLQVETESGVYLQPITPRELQQDMVITTVGEVDPKAQISIENHHMMVQPFPGRVMVREMVILNNQGSGPAPAGSITFELPRNLRRVIPRQGFRSPKDFTLEDGNLRYGLQVGTGVTVLEWFYMIPAENSVELARTVNRPVRQFRARIVKLEGLTIDYENLSEQQSKSNGDNMKRLIAESLNAGDRYKISLSGLSDVEPMKMPMTEGGPGVQGSGPGNRSGGPPGSPPPPAQRRRGGLPEGGLNWPIVLGIGFSLVVFAGSYGYVRYVLDRREPALERDFVIEEIARLDEAFEQDLLSEDYYEETRDRLKRAIQEADSSTG